MAWGSFLSGAASFLGAGSGLTSGLGLLGDAAELGVGFMTARDADKERQAASERLLADQKLTAEDLAWQRDIRNSILGRADGVRTGYEDLYDSMDVASTADVQSAYHALRPTYERSALDSVNRAVSINAANDIATGRHTMPTLQNARDRSYAVAFQDAIDTADQRAFEAALTRAGGLGAVMNNQVGIYGSTQDRDLPLLQSLYGGMDNTARLYDSQGRASLLDANIQAAGSQKAFGDMQAGLADSFGQFVSSLKKPPGKTTDYVDPDGNYISP